MGIFADHEHEEAKLLLAMVEKPPPDCVHWDLQADCVSPFVVLVQARFKQAY